MTEQAWVNVRSIANAAKVRKEKRNGRDVMVVPSATLPDDVIMNGVKYPAAEIEASYMTLNRTPAPLGHPMVNGKFVSSRDPEGINVGYIGAWNENVRRENGRVLLDKIIDVEIANRSEGGRKVLAAIAAGGPINTSTGLLCRLENAVGATDHKRVARSIVFDHDAILLNEEGAATPEQGVGMLVNSKGEIEEIPVINSALEDAERELDWAGMRLLEAADRLERATVWERMKTAILGAMPSEREPSVNTKENDMAVSDEQFKALSEEVKTLSDGMKGMGEQITNAVSAAVKPLIDAQAAMVANQKAKDDAEKVELVNKVVKANLLTEAVANALTLDALRELAPKAEPGKAAGLHNALGKTETGGFKLPKAEG